MRLSIIIPAYNEAPTIREVVEAAGAVAFPIDYEIILVDDASIDSTPQVILRLGESTTHLRPLSNPVNLGKGWSVRRGLEHARGNIVIVQDADLELDPRDIPALIQPIIEGQADAVYGSRFLRRSWPEKMAFPNWLANKILNFAANALYRARLTDVSCGYKAVRTDLLKSLALKCRRFEFCFEVTAKLRRRDIKISEVPISFTARTRKEGKKIGTRDFFVAMWTLLKYRFTG
jgi:glycosyltransferase involved in cell wall biosynthesis